MALILALLRIMCGSGYLSIWELIGYTRRRIRGRRAELLLVCLPPVAAGLLFRLGEAAFYSLLLYFGALYGWICGTARPRGTADPPALGSHRSADMRGGCEAAERCHRRRGGRSRIGAPAARGLPPPQYHGICRGQAHQLCGARACGSARSVRLHAHR